ncbi:hypothetical protein ABBQ32_013313 [Trebouxia sp. C0010 RCD-2024]
MQQCEAVPGLRFEVPVTFCHDIFEVARKVVKKVGRKLLAASVSQDLLLLAAEIATPLISALQLQHLRQPVQVPERGVVHLLKL